VTHATMKKLLSPERPWYGIDLKEGEFGALAEVVGQGGGLLRSVDAADARTVEGLFDSVADVFEFPDYFGSNWAALDECLADLDWLPAVNAYVLVLRSAADVLVDEPSAELATLLRVFEKVAQQWARPVELGEWWDRPARSFHALFQEGESRRLKLVSRFRDVGRDLEWIDLA